MSLHFTSNEFVCLNEQIVNLNPDLLVFIVDENTHDYCLPILLQSLQITVAMEIIEIPIGEEAKDIEIACSVWQSLIEFKATKKTLLINCGGGVVTDFGGFVGSLFKRGIQFINIPTSLLAMVDASIGGKTGINFLGLKNQIGTFTDANQVHIYKGFLKTLPQKELMSGLAEMLKHALISNQNNWNSLIRIKEFTASSVSDFIQDSVQIKQDIVLKDFKEHGIRKHLNLGHTIGHAIESYFSRRTSISHGHAVATGIILESHISYQKGILELEDFKEITDNIFKLYPKLELPRPSEIYTIMQHDKKNTDATPRYIVLERIGKVYDKMVIADSEELIAALEFYKSYKR